MASIRKRGSNSYLIVVSRGYDYEGNRLKSVQKTVKPPKEYTPKQAEKWVKEQAILFEREVQHTPEPINRSITLAKYIEHWVMHRQVQRWIFTPMHSTRTSAKRKKNLERRLDYDEKNQADTRKQKYPAESTCTLLLPRESAWA